MANTRMVRIVNNHEKVFFYSLEKIPLTRKHAAIFYFYRGVNKVLTISGLQPIPRDPKDNGVAAMLDDRTFCFVIQHGRHAIVFLYLQGLVANHL